MRSGMIRKQLVSLNTVNPAERPWVDVINKWWTLTWNHGDVTILKHHELKTGFILSVCLNMGYTPQNGNSTAVQL